MVKKLSDFDPGQGMGVSSVTWDEYWSRNDKNVHEAVGDRRVIKLTDLHLFDAIYDKFSELDG